MLSYKTAQKLKDAGFPQGDLFCWIREKDHDYYLIEYKHKVVMNKAHDMIFCAAPVLSELIEACGKDFYMLIYSPEENIKWKAVSGLNRKHYYVDAINPEEAVAALWLKLNSH
jgi:hypothetical protein